MQRVRSSRRVLFASLAMLLVAGVAAAALTEIWIYTFTSDGTFGGIAVVSDGSVFWVGQEGERHYIQRFDADGDRTMRTQVKGRDVPSEAALTPDESLLIVAGETRPTSNSFPFPWIAGYNLKGKQQWSTWLDLELGAVRRIAVSADGQDIYVTGSQVNFGADPDVIFVARLNTTGEVLWTVTYESGDNPDALALAVDPKKGDRVCVGGEGGQLLDPPYQEALLVCFDTADGSVIWDDLSGSTSGWDGIAAIVISPNGKKIYAVGYQDGANSGPDRRWFFQQFKAKNGKRKKRALGTLRGLGADEPNSLVAIDGGFAMSGHGCVDFWGGCDAYLVILNGRGKPQGDMITYAPGGDRQAIPESLAIGPEGNLIWGGQVDSYDGPMWLQKVMR